MRNDPLRLAESHRLMVLDSAPDRDLDAITQLLATSLGVPMAMLNLLDVDRDWFKSCVGLQRRESPAITSFCESLLISADDIIVSEDTTLDPRFQQHPMVTGAPRIRFYAAARLVVNKQTVGTLCAYGLQPKSVSLDQLQQLQTLANAALAHLVRHAAP
jgi:GAF domain-containing protein